LNTINDSLTGPRPADLLARHGGEMAAAMRAHDWAASPLGPPERWSQALRTLVDLMLASRQPMFMAWGPDRTWLYNDAFIPILGRKHPGALGRPAMEVWAEARADLEPLFDQVFRGAPVQMDDFGLELDRHGRMEEAHFAFSYTPAREADGTVAGLFGACIETTDKVIRERERAQDLARQRRLFEQAPGFIAVLQGPEHVFEFANAAYVRLVGGREVIGRSVREALPEVEAQGFPTLLDQVYATGQRFLANQIPVRLQGSAEELYLDFVYEPITDETGAVSGIFVEGHDVTAVRQAQEELRRNERRQALLVELGDRFRDLDEPADISFAAAELLGRALGVSRAGYGTVDPRDETIVIERDWNAPGIKTIAGKLRFRDYGSYIEDLKRGDTAVVEDAYQDPRTRDTADALKAISAQAFVNMPVTEQAGMVALLYLNHETARPWPAEELAFIREVAERTRMAVERRRAEKDLMALTASLEQQVAERTAERDRVWRNSRDLLVVVGADGVFRRVNPAWTEILGHDPSEVEGRSFLDFVWPEDAARTQAGLAEAADADDLTNFENRYRAMDGTPRWISWHTSVEGDLVYAYGRDITAEKAQAEALRQAEEALRQSQKLEAMGQLTGGVAHDFNNLLTPIVGGLDMLQRRGLGGPREQRLIDGALQSAERAKTLVQRLLAFSRRQPLQAAAVDVAGLVRGMSELVASTTGPQIRVAVEVADDLPAAAADPNQLEMAILNLSVNARDAMPDGGTLRISAVARQAEPRNRLSLKPGAYVCLSVADTGIGMDEATLARAVEPFFSTKGVGKGTGLGLSMAHGLAAQLGGVLNLSSRPGLGTNVELWLPVSEAPPESAERPAAPATPAGDLGAALLVDDEELARSSTADMLKELGYKVVEARSGEQALALLHDGLEPTVLVTDHLMPGLSGVDLAREAQTLRPQMRVLVISGFAEKEGIAPDLPRLAKPFRQAELAAMLAEMAAG
jgi:PAS domain S-box-containing protein